MLSDFLSGKEGSLDITGALSQGTGTSDLAKRAADADSKGSAAALWMLLLLRLTTVASDDRLDLRNSAIQTLLRIFDAYGDRFSAEAWVVCIKAVVFKLLTALEEELKSVQGAEADDGDRSDWNGTAVVVLNGISGLVANYLEVVTQHESFEQLWRDLLDHFCTLLDFGVLDINTATFKALIHILSHSTDHHGKLILSKPMIEPVWQLWSRGVPLPWFDGDVRRTTAEKEAAAAGDNQACLSAYVEALGQVYKLIEPDITTQRADRMLYLLQVTVQEATVGSYSTDVEQVTQVQGQVLGAIEALRTDVDEMPALVIKHVSELVELPFDDEATPKRTFVALSKASMRMLEKLVLAHHGQKHVYDSQALEQALEALKTPITLKYDFTVPTRSEKLWRVATSTALAILKPTLPQLDKLDVSRDTRGRIWAKVMAIADGILDADCSAAPEGPVFLEDEQFDIDAFAALRGLILPALGAENVGESARKAYVASLFASSTIHEPTVADVAVVKGESPGGLSDLYTPGEGRTAAVPPARRTRMAYAALDELFRLVSAADPSSDPAADKHRRLAATAAPYLIMRCGLTLRAYVADQPLRGKMPQPLSQRRELVRVLGQLVHLRSEGSAIPALEGVASDGRKHLLRLYPLIVRALGVGSDREVDGLLRQALDVVGGELGF